MQLIEGPLGHGLGGDRRERDEHARHDVSAI
jgi:hypothetical protein